MKSSIFFILFLYSFGIRGQVDGNDLPRRISKSVQKTFESNDVFLDEISGSNPQNENEQKFFRVKTAHQSAPKGYLHIGRVNTCRAGGCDSPSTFNETNASEYFDYFILFDEKLIVNNIRIFNYQASHGHEITARGWLKQFWGFNGRDTLKVGKDIDGISGATVSVYAITTDVQYKTKKLIELID